MYIVSLDYLWVLVFFFLVLLVEFFVKRIIFYIKVFYFISLFFIDKIYGKEILRFDFFVCIVNV